MKKFVLCFDETSDNFKNVVNQIYHKFNTYLLNSKNSTRSNFFIENINPLGPEECTLDIDIRNNISKLYKLEDNDELCLLNINDVQQQMRFTIYPIVFINSITISKEKAYTNYVVHEAYLQFDKPILKKDDIINIFKK